MTTLKAEQIRAALHEIVKVAVADLPVPRNAALSDLGEGGRLVTLTDGDVEQTEAFFNPPVYEFTMRPRLFVLIDWTLGTSPDDELATLIGTFATAIEAAGTLGDLVTAIRVEPPDFAPRELFGAANMKAAELVIELDYWSTSSLG